MNHIHHWIDGRVVESTSGRTGAGVQPGARRAVGRRRPRIGRRGRRRRRGGEGGVPGVALDEPVEARRGACSASASWSTPTARRSRRMLTAEHGKVLSDAMGEVARGLENIEFACGVPHLLKGGYTEQAATGVDVYSIRQPLGVVAGITPFNFPAMVPMWMFANALACGNTFVLKPSEKDPSASLFLAELLATGRAAGGLLQRRAGRQGRRRPAARAPRHRRGELRRLDADRQVHLRDGHRERQAGAGARRREEPHARAARRRPRHGRRRLRSAPRTARPASAAWRSASCSPPRRSPTSSSPRSPSASRSVKVGPGNEPDSEMGPLITGEHRDKVASYIEARTAEGATVVVDGRRTRPAAGLLPRPEPDRPRHARHGLLRQRDLRPGAVGGARPRLRGRRRDDQRQPVRATARRSSPATAAPPASSSSTSRSAWSASTCRSRCR